ncbi:GTP-binding protein Di-Ras2-like [Mytilus galloprovincialis]|uniref:GTP-binding protein Di-Ras2-like n=1 Tax=Mytilus galloprovincialis TaxID=29158 RepID=UPI003F7BE0B1
MTELQSRSQIAVLGLGRVGKSSILQRYLKGKFSGAYRETVEDIYPQPYDINGKRRFVDFIDTAGNIYFPAMRKIYISKAGFILVYSICDSRSFEEVQKLWNEIKSARVNNLSIPVVIVGNKLDEENNRQVETFAALEWAYRENLGGCFIEVSAKDNNAVTEVFDMLLEQLGNRRAAQPETFRIRSTSFTRKEKEFDKCRNNGKQKKNKQMVSYEKVQCSSKGYQDNVFDDFKESTIYRVQRKQMEMCRSMSDSDTLQKPNYSGRQFLRSISMPDEKSKSGYQGWNRVQRLMKKLFRRSDSMETDSSRVQKTEGHTVMLLHSKLPGNGTRS